MTGYRIGGSRLCQWTAGRRIVKVACRSLGRSRHGVLQAPQGRIDEGHHARYHDAMERTTISLPEDLLKRLRLLAAERRTSMAALIREALEEKSAAYRPRPRSLGVGASGRRDTARRAGEERPQPRPWR